MHKGVRIGREARRESAGRNISRHRTAVSSRRRFKTVRMRCSYFGTRASCRVETKSSSLRSLSAERTSSSPIWSTGSRLERWLQAFTSAFSESG